MVLSKAGDRFWREERERMRKEEMLEGSRCPEPKWFIQFCRWTETELAQKA